MNSAEIPTLILFSGLPGSGKTTLARRLAGELQIPLFSKDRLQACLRALGLAQRATGDGYELILDLADEQLGLGVSVILDAVFPLPGYREKAGAVAGRHCARLKVCCCFCSDETAWQVRMVGRRQFTPDWTPVGWEEVLRLKELYQPWPDGQDLIRIDGCEAEDMNVQRLLAWLKSDNLADLAAGPATAINPE